MNKIITLLAFSLLIAGSTQAQKNCFDVYSNTYKLQGGLSVPDGMQKIVVAIKDVSNNALCVEGQMMVRNDTIILPVYILRENGSYSETYGKLDNNYYRQTLYKISYGIIDAMSAVFTLEGNRKGRIFFPDYLKPNPGTMVSAPASPNEAKAPKPKQEDMEKISMSAQSIQFQTGKSVISSQSYSGLDVIAGVMVNYPDTKWSIDGFTDNVGKEGSNFKLSENRAAAIEDYLIKKGVKPANLFAAGHGSADPVADNSTADGRKKNRRVEIKPI